MGSIYQDIAAILTVYWAILPWGNIGLATG